MERLWKANSCQYGLRYRTPSWHAQDYQCYGEYVYVDKLNKLRNKLYHQEYINIQETMYRINRQNNTVEKTSKKSRQQKKYEQRWENFKEKQRQILLERLEKSSRQETPRQNIPPRLNALEGRKLIEVLEGPRKSSSAPQLKSSTISTSLVNLDKYGPSASECTSKIGRQTGGYIGGNVKHTSTKLLPLITPDAKPSTYKRQAVKELPHHSHKGKQQMILLNGSKMENFVTDVSLEAIEAIRRAQQFYEDEEVGQVPYSTPLPPSEVSFGEPDDEHERQTDIQPTSADEQQNSVTTEKNKDLQERITTSNRTDITSNESLQLNTSQYRLNKIDKNSLKKIEFKEYIRRKRKKKVTFSSTKSDQVREAMVSLPRINHAHEIGLQVEKTVDFSQNMRPVVVIPSVTCTSSSPTHLLTEQDKLATKSTALSRLVRQSQLQNIEISRLKEDIEELNTINRTLRDRH